MNYKFEYKSVTVTICKASKRLWFYTLANGRTGATKTLKSAINHAKFLVREQEGFAK